MSGRPENPRRIALDVLLDCLDRGAYANLRLKEVRAEHTLTERDYRYVAAAVYGTLDHLLYIDFMLSNFTETKGQKPVIRGILRLGAHEMLFLRARPAVACDEAVKLTREVGKHALTGYINGVLRALSRSLHDLPPLPDAPEERMSILYSWPEWMVARFITRFGEADTEALLRAMAAERGLQLRAHPPGTAKEITAMLKERGIAYTPGRLETNCLHIEEGLDVLAEPLFTGGRMAVQGEGAMLACRAVGAKPGMRVLDACAAPGGKSAYIAALADGVQITAWELHAHRLELLRATLRRLHVDANLEQRDAAQPAPEYENMFDAVLLDVPCSGLGTAGSKPDIRYRKAAKDIAALAHLQRGILDACANYVCPGGALVYASCTISEAENEAQVRAFLERDARFALDDLAPYLPVDALGPVPGMTQLLPHVHGTEGFFIARLHRREEP